MSAFFAATGLRKRFGGVVAVDDVSLELQPGELVGLIGPNGSGKSTTINLIAGAATPDRGELRLDGETLAGLPTHRFVRRGIARTFQVPRLFRRMTVLENLLVPALTTRALTRLQAERRAEEVLEFLRCQALAQALARELSGGQQKLLELGRALMLRPRLLLLDEPFAGVHPQLLEQIAGHLRQLATEGYTIVLVDHNLDAVHALVQRTVVMARGRKIADGLPQDVLSDPAVIQSYTGGTA